jgi:hypothetical protein
VSAQPVSTEIGTESRPLSKGAYLTHLTLSRCGRIALENVPQRCGEDP